MSKGRSGLDDLAQDHWRDAFRLALRLTGDAHSAEEITQDAFVRAAKGWRRFRGAASPKTWLFRIVVNAFRTRCAKKTDRPEPLDEEHLADGSQADPASRSEMRELHEQVAQLVSSLPPRQREVLVLHAFHSHDHRQISQVLGMSEQNVRTTLHLARERLKRLLGPMMNETRHE